MMGKWTPKTTLIVAGVAVAGLWYLKRQGVQTVQAAANAVNPLNNENVFYGGVNSVGAELTGDEHFTLGGWLYDLTHGEPEI